MKLLLAGVALASLCTTIAVAQDAPPPPPPGAHGPTFKPITKAEVTALVAQHFAALDLNHDGKVTKEEIKTAREAQFEKRAKEHRDREFATLDSNHDGSISKAEFDVPHLGHPGGPGGPEGPGGPPPGWPDGPGKGGFGGPAGLLMAGGRWFDRADANHDGVVTLAEAQTAAATLFDTLDTNHDGTVSPDEIRAAFGGHHGSWDEGGPGGRRHGGPGGDGPPPPPPPRN